MAIKLRTPGEAPLPTRSRTPPHRTQRVLRFDLRRRNVPPHATPQELLDMAVCDSAALVRRIRQALEHVDETGRLHPSDLKLPIFASPQYYKQFLPGYAGGAFDPETLGATYVVVPGTAGTWNPCTWSLSQVLTPTPPS